MKATMANHENNKATVINIKMNLRQIAKQLAEEQSGQF